MKLDDEVNLKEIAENAHGFVGSDLAQLCLEATLFAVREHFNMNNDNGASMSNHHDSNTIDLDGIDDDLLNGLKVKYEHFTLAALKCNPSSLRENVIEISNVKWEDIGGLKDTKQELREMVEYPVTYAHKFKVLYLFFRLIYRDTHKKLF